MPTDWERGYDIAKAEQADKIEWLESVCRGHVALNLEQAETIERLEAFVDKLPKTKDGVHVLPGDIVWHNGEHGLERRNVQWSPPASPSSGYLAWYGLSGPPVIISCCYSTREVAEKAWEESDG